MAAKRNSIIVLIATSGCRNDFLFTVSLASVLKQTVSPDEIVIVDDNDDPIVSANIRKNIRDFDGRMCPINLIPNRLTRHKSGSGAWNTGIAYITGKFGDDSYIAILDDDDEWLPAHLSSCANRVHIKDGQMADAVFGWIKRGDCKKAHRFSKKDLTIEAFLCGNPGVQGSNMFFRASVLKRLDGFDEQLASCTDRDLMIRFLSVFGSDSVNLTRRVSVIHHTAHATVTNNFLSKKDGLDVFYRKHLPRFTFNMLKTSLERAEKLFSYPNSNKVVDAFQNELLRKSRQHIVVGVMLHNNGKTINRCLSSIFNQTATDRKIIVVLQNDNSNDKWNQAIREFKGTPNLIIRNVYIGEVAKARTEMNKFILHHVDNIALIARLDADDELADDHVLSRIERLFDLHGNPDVVLAGNFLRESESGRILKRVNKSDRRLRNRNYLLNRLWKMAHGVKDAELPSCNLFLAPTAVTPFPELPSAEDHALLVHYLCNLNYTIAFAKDCLAVVYSLHGRATMSNKTNTVYRDCRKLLYKKVALNGKAY